MATPGSRGGSTSPGPEVFYNSQGASQEDLDHLISQYAGVSLSQGSAPASPRRVGSQNPSLGVPSPQRSPYPSRAHPYHATSSQHSPGHSPPKGGYETSGNVISTSWANIPAATEEEGELFDAVIWAIYVSRH